MFRGTPQETRFLEGETCLKLWMSLDSLSKVRAALIRDGVVSNRTGKAPSCTGIEHSAKRWILRNPERARAEYVEPFERARGRTMDDSSWAEYLVRLAMTHLTSAGYEKYIAKHGLQDAALRISSTH